jgi:hypothetical protein
MFNQFKRELDNDRPLHDVVDFQEQANVTHGVLNKGTAKLAKPLT